MIAKDCNGTPLRVGDEVCLIPWGDLCSGARADVGKPGHVISLDSCGGYIGIFIPGSNNNHESSRITWNSPSIRVKKIRREVTHTQLEYNFEVSNERP